MKTREPIAHNTQKMLNGSHDHRQEFLLIKQDDKFFSRLLSKEKSCSTKGESSFRFYYYGDSSKGSIPFRWESQPGTPKHPLSAASLPPLTPPPSYQSAAELKSGSRRSARNSVTSFFSKFSSKKTSCSSSRSNNVSPSLSSSSCSSSFSLPSSTTPTAALTGRRHRSRSDFQLRLEELFRDDGSPTSTLCFGGRGNGGAAASGSGSKSFHARRRSSSWLCLNNISVF